MATIDMVRELCFVFSQLEMKQRYLVGKMNVSEEKEEGHGEVTMESLGEHWNPTEVLASDKLFGIVLRNNIGIYI